MNITIVTIYSQATDKFDKCMDVWSTEPWSWSMEMEDGCEEKSHGSDSKARVIHALGLEINIAFTRQSRAVYTFRKYEITIQDVVFVALCAVS